MSIVESRRALCTFNHSRTWQIRRGQRFGFGGCELQPQDWPSHSSGKHDGFEIPWRSAYPNCTASCCSDWTNVSRWYRTSSSSQDCYVLHPAARTTDSTLASKIAGSLTHRAAVRLVRKENLRETPMYPHSSATGARIKSGVASNWLLRQVTWLVDPWGTPAKTRVQSEAWLLSTTRCRPER